MTGDFSGRYIELDLNESGVLYQQGRVFLDQDGNAETRFVNRWQDTAGQDIIGSGVLGVPADDPNAFKVETAQVVGPDVEIGVDPGHAWADGLLVYLQGTAPIARTATYLGPPFENPVPTVATIGAGIRDAVILEVWREALNAFQVPNELIEPALGGPDTTERVYTAMDFRLFRMGADDTCDSIAGRIADNFGAKGKLTVSLQPAVVIPGDCPVSKLRRSTPARPCSSGRDSTADWSAEADSTPSMGSSRSPRTSSQSSRRTCPAFTWRHANSTPR
jgi:hypothetical protein